MPHQESFQQEVFGIIQSISGEKNMLAIPRLFLQATGDLETGTFLAQLVYWSDKGSRTDGYIYKSLEEWSGEIFLSKYALRKARMKLEELGILKTMVKKANGNPTLHYKLLRKPFIDWLVRFRKNESSKTNEGKFENEVSITETTPNITLKNYDNEKGCFSGVETSSPLLNHQDYSEGTLYTKNYFLARFKKTFNADHPRLKPKQWRYCLDALESFLREFDLGPEHIEGMVDNYFATDFQCATDGKGCDYRFNHFCTEGVLQNRFYEGMHG